MSCQCKIVVLYRGDDSNFEYNQRVAIVIATEYDLSGCSAHFSLLGYQQDFAEIPEDKTLRLVFPASVTAKYPLGMANGTLWIIDPEGRRRTVSNAIHFLVTNNVDVAYGESDEQTIRLGICGIVDYSSIANKPSINGHTVEGEMTGEDLGLANHEEVVRAQETADDALEGLAGKRGVTDMAVRGAPVVGGSWFTLLDGDQKYTYSFVSEGHWAVADSNRAIRLEGSTYTEYNPDTGTDHFSFALSDEFNYSYTDENYGTVIGYIDTLARSSQIPGEHSAYDGNPEMDGTASPGASDEWARGDHVHPRDTSKLNESSAYPEWLESETPYGEGDVVSRGGTIWKSLSANNSYDPLTDMEVHWTATTIKVLKQDKLSEQQIENINAVPSKAPIDSPAFTGTPTAPTAPAGTGSTQVATTAFVQGALPYATAVIGEWSYSGYSEGVLIEGIDYDPDTGLWTLSVSYEGEDDYLDAIGTPSDTTVSFIGGYKDPSDTIVATRSLTLLDRAVNEVRVTDPVVLTLPFAVSGKSRDFYLKMDVLDDHQVSFEPSSGTTYTGYGNPARTYSAGSYLLRFTETSANVFNITNMYAATGSYNDLTEKPSIPTVDTTLTQPGAAADAKAVGDALTSKRNLDDMNIYADPMAGHTPIQITVWDSDELSTLYTLDWNGTAWSYTNGDTHIQVLFDYSSQKYILSGSVPDYGGTYHYLDHLFDLTSPLWSTDYEAPGFYKIEIKSIANRIATTTQIPSASSETPQMNGTGAAGSSDNYSREDHVHPTDSTRAPIASPTFTGTPKAPTPQAGDNSTNIATTAFVNNHHDSQIVDADGNKIEADGDMTIRDNDLPWSVESDFFGNHTLNNTAVNHWEVIYDDDSNKLELDFNESSYWDLTHYWKDGDNWEQDGVYIASGDENATSLAFSNASATRSLTRHDAVAPKSWVQEQLPSVPSASTSTPQMDGTGSTGTETAWARGDHVHPSDTRKANVTDLPYALVTPGEWEFSNGGSYTMDGPYETDPGGPFTSYYWKLCQGSTVLDESVSYETTSVLSVEFPVAQITATRATFPGHILDRAVNAVSVSGATTITLPSLITGKSRDLLVRMTVTADSAVTFSAPTGETVMWDDAGSPTATYEAGAHLLRFTEISQGLFHFDDLGNAAIAPAVLAAKLDATSAAPAFDPTKTYSVGEYVTYEGVLYECTTAVTTAGAWTGSTNWTATNMTTPDATLDIMADGRLRLVSSDGTVLWMQGYSLASASSVTLSCEKVNYYAFSSGTLTAAFTMPTAPYGMVGDFVLDIDNSANASDSATATLTGAGTAFDIYTANGENISTDILTFAGGEVCELYFTMTAFGTAAKPAWKVVKQVVEKAVFSS